MLNQIYPGRVKNSIPHRMALLFLLTDPQYIFIQQLYLAGTLAHSNISFDLSGGKPEDPIDDSYDSEVTKSAASDHISPPNNSSKDCKGH